MAAKPLPSAEELRKLFEYDPETGVLTWRLRPGDSPADRSRNKRWGGKPAGYINDGKRLVVEIDGPVKVHRVIWKMVFGTDPNVIDHINGDSLDNRLHNLRDTTVMTNAQNARRNRKNTSGHAGVYWNRKNLKWIAQIRCANKTSYLGSFELLEEAVKCRKKAEVDLGFHPNHGKPRALKDRG